MHAYLQGFGEYFTEERMAEICLSLESAIGGGLKASAISGGQAIPTRVTHIRCELTGLPHGFESINRIGGEPYEPTEAVPGFDTKAQAIVGRVLRHLSDTMDHSVVKEISVFDTAHPKKTMKVSSGEAVTASVAA